MRNRKLFENVGIQIGGYGVHWGEQLTISDTVMYHSGVDVPLSVEDFRSYVSKRVVDTTEAMELLECTRQNMNDPVKRGKLTPVKKRRKILCF